MALALARRLAHAKLVLIVALRGNHLTYYHYLKAFRVDKNTKAHVFHQYFNEFPTLLLLSIIILVVVKPF